MLYLLALIIVVFSITIPDLFLSEITIQSVFRSQAVHLALAALCPSSQASSTSGWASTWRRRSSW